MKQQQKYSDEENWNRTCWPDEGPISVAEGDSGACARVVLAGGNPL